jgi:hypothetical protein
VAFGAIALGSCGGTNQPRPTVVLEILAAQSTLDSFSVSADPLQSQPKLQFEARFLAKSFVTFAPLEEIEGEPISVTVISPDSVQVSSIAIAPFVCAEDPTFAQKIQSGWQGTETLQVYLQPDGSLNPENEFDRQLAHRCDWLAPGGGSGEGLATTNRSPGLCTESDRTGTNLEILDLSDASAPRVLGTTTCNAYHDNRTSAPDFAGVIADQIGIATTLGGSQPAIVLSHCWSGSETYPSQIAVGGDPAVSCPYESMVIATDSPAPTVLPASGGSWTLANGPLLPGGGHQIADVDLTFGVAGNGTPVFSVKGHIDLPIVKVNLVNL